MKKTLLLLLVSLFCGVGTSIRSSDLTLRVADVPPTIEEIHLDLLLGSTPPKPRSVVTLPVSAWYQVDDHSLILDSQPQTGWLNVYVEDEAGIVLLSKVLDGNVGHNTVDVSSLSDGFYSLFIYLGVTEPMALVGRFEVH